MSWWVKGGLAACLAACLAIEFIMILRLSAAVYDPTPWFDEWYGLRSIERIAAQPSSLGRELWRPHNEHRLVLPRLAFLADFWWFGGRNLFAFACSGLALGATLALVGSATRWTQSPCVWRRAVLCLAAWCVLLMGGQASNFVWAFQLQWFSTHAWLAAGALALVAAARAYPESRRKAVALLALSGTSAAAASMSTASGLAGWLLLVLGSVLLRGTLPGSTPILAAAGGAAFSALYLGGLSPSGVGQASIAAVQAKPGLLIELLVSYLGSPLAFLGSRAPQLAGAVYLATYSICSSRIVRRGLRAHSSLEAFGFLLASFPLVTGTIVALGRAELGTAGVVESRFVSGVLLGAGGLMLVVFEITPAQSRAGRLLAGWPGTAVLLCVSVFAVASHLRLPYDYSGLPTLKRAAATALVAGVDDEEALSRVGALKEGTTFQGELTRFLRREQRSIFTTVASRCVGLPKRDCFGRERSGCTGSIDAIAVVHSNEGRSGYRLSGWAWDEIARETPRELVLVDDRDIIVGIAKTGWQRPDLSPALPRSGSGRTGWVGHASRAASAHLTAFAVVDSGFSLCAASVRATLAD